MKERIKYSMIVLLAALFTLTIPLAGIWGLFRYSEKSNDLMINGINGKLSPFYSNFNLHRNKDWAY